MPHKVVKPFPYAEDGLTLVDLNVGDERDFGVFADGLVAEGWVEAVSGASEPASEPEPAAEPVAAEPEAIEQPAEKPVKRAK